MKYIISESRLDKVIIGFIESQLEPYEQKKISGFSYEASVFWVKNHILVAEYKSRPDGLKFFYLKYQIFDLIKDMFSINERDTKYYINKYLQKKSIDVDAVDWIGLKYQQDDYNEQYL